MNRLDTRVHTLPCARVRNDMGDFEMFRVTRPIGQLPMFDVTRRKSRKAA